MKQILIILAMLLFCSTAHAELWGVGSASTLGVQDAGDENATYYLGLWRAVAGALVGKTDGGLTYNPSTNVFTLGGDLNIISTGTDVTIIFDGTGGNTATFKFETDNNRYVFDKTIKMLSLGKIITFAFGSAGITSWTQANLDLFGTTAVRIGDSQNGVPTNYTQFSAGVQTMVGTARVIKHLHFTMELGKGQSAPAERFDENPYVSYTYGINDDSHLSREAPDNMDYTVDSIVKIHWYTTDATAGGADEVRWEVQWASRAVGEDITAGDTTDNSGDIVCSAQNIIVETTVETIVANSIAAGDMIGIHVKRVALGDGTNPQASTIHIIDVELQYTSNKLGESL